MGAKNFGEFLVIENGIKRKYILAIHQKLYRNVKRYICIVERIETDRVIWFASVACSLIIDDLYRYAYDLYNGAYAYMIGCENNCEGQYRVILIFFIII